MKYEEFVEWTNKRACDGCWGFKEALYCIDVRRTIESLPFWRRRKAWEEVRPTAEAIVSEINKKIDELRWSAMTIEKAIEILKAEYEEAKTQPFVQKPLAYALYHTWKKVDETLNRRKEREKK